MDSRCFKYAKSHADVQTVHPVKRVKKAIYTDTQEWMNTNKIQHIINIPCCDTCCLPHDKKSQEIKEMSRLIQAKSPSSSAKLNIYQNQLWAIFSPPPLNNVSKFSKQSIANNAQKTSIAGAGKWWEVYKQYTRKKTGNY